MRDFKRNNFSDKRRSFGDRKGSRGDRFRPATMYPAVCSNCGKNCEVPFQPTGEKPVYCRDCFQERQERSGTDDRRPERKSFPRQNFQDRSTPAPDYGPRLDALTQKVDKILELLNQAVVVDQPSEEEVVVEAVEEKAVPEKKKKSAKKPA